MHCYEFIFLLRLDVKSMEEKKDDQDRLGLEDGRVSVSVSRPDMNALSGQAMADCFFIS